MESGRVIQSTGKWYKVRVGDDVLDCRLRGKMRLQKKAATNPVAAGDHVEITRLDDGTGQIERVQPRKNHLPRQATHGRRGEQVLAANIDRAWAVLSIRSPAFRYGFIDRFLVTCEAYDLPAGVIFNKLDLATKNDLNTLDHARSLYQSLGYPVLVTSIHHPDSLNSLKDELKDRISVFIGPSGVGKSSLLNALDPTLDLRTGDISDYSGKGQHTTTAARLVALESGGEIVDTPGIRELGLVHISSGELSLYFPEMNNLSGECKYYNCTHSHEPGCRLMEALEQGLIDPERYNSYLQILDSLPDSE